MALPATGVLGMGGHRGESVDALGKSSPCMAGEALVFLTFFVHKIMDDIGRGSRILAQGIKIVQGSGRRVSIHIDAGGAFIGIKNHSPLMVKLKVRGSRFWGWVHFLGSNGQC